VEYKESAELRPDRRKEERAIIRTLQLEGWRLLNSFPRYCCPQTCEKDEREAVQAFCNMLIASHSKALPHFSAL